MIDKDNIPNFEQISEIIYDDRNEKQELEKRLENIPSELPVIPLKDIVIFPYMVYPVLIGRDSTIRAVNKSLETDKYVFLLTQKDPKAEDPTSDVLYTTGTVAKLIQVLRMPNRLIKIIVDGLATARVESLKKDSYLSAVIKIMQRDVLQNPEFEALIRKMTTLFSQYVIANEAIPQETFIAYESIKEPERKVFFIASSLNIDVPKKQNILEIDNLSGQIYEILFILSSVLETLKIEKEIDNKVYKVMQKNQRKFLVQEQIKILQDELGEGAELDPDLVKIKEQIDNSGMTEKIKEKAIDEFDKLRKTPMMSPDYGVIRNYLDWMVSVPWNKFTEDNLDIEHARKILDEDHYDLEKPKERILELIAVLKLLKEKNIKRTPKGQILCLVGPPGVGKTSLGKSIARALNRKFTRISVGGVRDEAEIRGHRRTYIGSMPGKIIQAMKKTGTSNPVVLIDEIDKMSSDFRGDPASAMLEVLDPEQNHTFNDHYLDVDYDLSKVLFITTANVQYNIPLPLQDRMEIIEMRSYLDFEKVHIAQRHIIPKELTEHGLEVNDIIFSENILLKLISEYTQESGVRNLEREITSIIRKFARDKVSSPRNKKNKPFTITSKQVEKYLGVPKYKKRITDKKERYKTGSVTGLAWTSMGGDILNVDVTVMNGTDKLILTGKLGEVMQESAQAGLSYIKSNADRFGIEPEFFKKHDIHIHLPEGAIKKDGPSAGITMIIAMVSAITKVPARTDVAMTGEITLRGNILPIGGLNEKLLAAVRNGIKTVLIPKDNEKDLTEISREITEKIKIVSIRKIDDTFEYLFKEKKLAKVKNNSKDKHKPE